MKLIENAWDVVKVSAAVWVGTALGALQNFYAYVNSSSAHIQEVLHFSAWSEWVPWVLGLATIFGVAFGRAVKQKSVERAANGQGGFVEVRLLAMIAAATMAALLATGCANHLPKPNNANGSVNASVAVAEAEITYRNLAHDATVYVSTCHGAPATLGCSEQRIQQIKVADNQAYKALQAAENAVKTLQPGASGIDRAIADLNAALVFLQSFVTPTTRPSP